jgi:hypothetical protein
MRASVSTSQEVSCLQEIRIPLSGRRDPVTSLMEGLACLGYTALESDDEGGVVVVTYCPLCAARENFVPVRASFT